MISIRMYAIMAAAILGFAGSALAEGNAPGVVSGTGVVTISRPADQMRLQITILGRGTALEEALKSLKDRTARARKELDRLGAAKDSIVVDKSRIVDAQQNDRQRQLQVMMMQRMGQKAKAKTPAVAPPITVSANLTAEWKLSPNESEDPLLTIHPLQQKIKAADLAGIEEAEALTPEQEELLEEMGTSFSYSSDDEQKPGQPTFVFLSRISEADRDKALSEAFGKARQQASRLANAAGVQLGELRSLQGLAGMGTDYDESSWGGHYNSSAYRAMQMMRARHGGDELSHVEAFGTEPGLVEFNVSVTALFDLKTK
jgi:uncharacterized protein YggE